MKACRVSLLVLAAAGLLAIGGSSKSMAAEAKGPANFVRPAVQETSSPSYAPVKFADLNARTTYSIVEARYGRRYYAGYRYPYRYGYYRPYAVYRPYVYRPYGVVPPYAYPPYYNTYYPPNYVYRPNGAYYW